MAHNSISWRQSLLDRARRLSSWGSYVGPLADWGKLSGDVPSATAILDRFLHHAEIVSITGRSYRLRNQGTQADEPKVNGQASKEGKRSRKDSAPSPAAEEKVLLFTPRHSYITRHEPNWLVLKRLPVAGLEAPNDRKLRIGEG